MTLSLLTRPASPYLVHHSGLSLDTSSGSITPFTTGDFITGTPNGDIYFRGKFQPKEDYAITVANAISGSHDIYIFQFMNGGTELYSIRYVASTGLYKIRINGTDQQCIDGQAGNVLSWGITGSEIDLVQLDAWWCPSIGRAGFYFSVNGVQNWGHDNTINLCEGRPGTPTISSTAPTTINIGDIYCDDTGCTGLRNYYTSGGTRSSANDANAPPILYDGIYQRANGQLQGDTGSDLDGRTYKSIAGEIPIGAGLATPTQFYLGSSGGTSDFLPVIWSEVGLMLRGSQSEGCSPLVWFIGDSQTTTWRFYAPYPSRCRAVAESNINKNFGMAAFPGDDVGFSGPGFYSQWVNSRGGLQARTGMNKGYVIQGSTNDIIRGGTITNIIGYIQTLINNIRTIDTSAPIILLPPPQEKGALSGSEYIVWQGVCKGCYAECVGNSKVSISSVANTTPIQINCLTAGMSTNDFLAVFGTGIVALDNKSFQITVVNGSQLTLNGTTASGTSSIGSVLDGGSNGINGTNLYFIGQIYNNNDGSHGGTADNLWTSADSNDGEHQNNIGRSSYGDSSPSVGSTVRTILTSLGLQLGG